MLDEGEDAPFQFPLGRKIAALEQAAGQRAEPDFDLVQPGAMLGRVHEADAVAGVLQEGGAGIHALQYPGLAFHAQIIFHAAQLGDQPDQAGRLVGVELVHDERPLPFGVGLHGGADVAGKILLGARVAHRRAYDLARRHLEVGDQRLRPVAGILELLGLRLAGFHRAGGVEPLQCLDAGLLVGADQVDPLFVEFPGLVVQFAHRPHLLPEAGLVLHLVVKPVSGPVGFQVPLILKNDLCWSRKSARRCPGGWLPGPVPGASSG